MKKIFFKMALLVFTFSVSQAYSVENPALHIYTDNVENRFEVGEEANIFVELMTDFEFPNGEAEISMEGTIIGFPPIVMESTQISNNLFAFNSPTLRITDVGERYFQVQLKVRSKKTSSRIKKAIKANENGIKENTISRNAATDEYVRASYQREINRLLTLNMSLERQLLNLFVPMGSPKELSFRVVARSDDDVSVVVSHKTLTISEGNETSYTLKVSSRPTSDVIVRVSANKRSIDLNGSQDNHIDLTFTPFNFDRPQTVKVKVPSSIDSAIISHEAFSRDSRFNGIVISSVNVNVSLESDLITVNFENVSTNISEGSVVEVKAFISSPSLTTITVPYIVCGTAEFPIDHNLEDGEITFLPGTTEASLFVTINEDEDDLEMSEDITIQLENPPSTVVLGNNWEHIITIQGL